MRRRERIVLAASALAVTGAAVGNETITYTYDSRGRLIKVGRGGTINNNVQAEYRYDKAGNCTKVKVASPNTTPPP